MALRAMNEEQHRTCSVRFDSESTMEGDYLLGVHAMREHGITGPINLGGGFNTDITARFEKMRAFIAQWPAELQRYMYGQFLLNPMYRYPLVEKQAVFKLAKTGHRPTMKFLWIIQRNPVFRETRCL